MLIMHDEVVCRIMSALYDYEDNQGTIREATFSALADHIAENGFSDFDGKELVVPEAPVAPVALGPPVGTTYPGSGRFGEDIHIVEKPEAPVISPATIKLLVSGINDSARFSLDMDSSDLIALRDSMVADGLIERVGMLDCKSLVGEAPVASVEWLGDNFDL